MKAFKEDLPKDYNRGPSDPYNQVKKYKNNTTYPPPPPPPPPPKTKAKAKNLHSIQIESVRRSLKFNHRSRCGPHKRSVAYDIVKDTVMGLNYYLKSTGLGHSLGHGATRLWPLAFC